MSFDENYLTELLISIDQTSIRIKRAANYMLFHRNDSVEKILEIWKNQFDSAAFEKKLLLIFVANEVIILSAKKAKTDFIIAFGNIFIDCFKNIIRSDKIELLQTLISLCDRWETDLIYANHFMEHLRKMIRERIKSLSTNESDQNGIENKNEINFISRFPLCKENLCLDVQEENIKNIYDHIDKDKLNKLLSNINDPDNTHINDVFDYEEKLKELRNILITDLVKRENFIFNLSDVIAREKNEFFSNENHIHNVTK